MANPTSYNFTKTVNVDRLSLEIKSSSIVIVLDHIDVLGTDVTIWFKDVLSNDDEQTLDGIIDSHVANPLPPDNPTIPVAVQTQPAVSIQSAPPFASKTIGTKKLYKRVTGIQASLNAGAQDVIYVIPFPWCKITGLEVVGGEALDIASFFVLDTATGAITGTPNAQLNQFGFSVNIAKDYYEHKSEFDADLYQNMQIKLSYNSVSQKSIGINFILNELK